MHITIQTSTFAKALARVQGVVERKSTQPALSHVLLNATSAGVLQVSATNHEMGLIGRYSAEVQTPGSIALQAKQLHDIVKALGEGEVSIEGQDNHWAEIRSGSSRFHLAGMPPEEFPEQPNAADIQTWDMAAGQLSRLIERSVFCVSHDETRRNLCGVYCESSADNNLRFVATDGHRLARVDEKALEGDVPLKSGVIVPHKALSEVRRLLGDMKADETVTLGFTAAMGVFRVGSVSITTKLVEGEFPNYTQVIPKEASKTVKFSRPAMMDALRRVSILAQGKSAGVRLSLREQELELSAEDPELGDAQETLAVEYEGDSLVVGFNARYLLEVLALFPEQGAVFELTDALSPAILRPLEDQDFLAVVMPIRIP